MTLETQISGRREFLTSTARGLAGIIFASSLPSFASDSLVTKPRYPIAAYKQRVVDFNTEELDAQLDHIQKSSCNILTGAYENCSLFDVVDDILKKPFKEALKLGKNTLDTVANLNADPKFKARKDAVNDIVKPLGGIEDLSILTEYNRSVTLLEKQQAGEIQLDDMVVTQLQEKVKTYGSVIDSSTTYLRKLKETTDPAFVIREEDRVTPYELIFGQQGNQSLDERIIERVKKTKEWQDYRDANVSNTEVLRKTIDQTSEALACIKRAEHAIDVEKDGEKARKELERALALNPGIPAIYYGFACSYGVDAEKNKVLLPLNAPLMVQFDRVYLSFGELPGQEKYYQRAKGFIEKSVRLGLAK